jgi:hypothetical protein
MIIAIIGKVNPDLAYEEWVSKLQTIVDIATVTQIIITISNCTLNQYVRKFAKLHNLIATEYAPDFKTYRDEAKIRRNVVLVESSDLILELLPKGTITGTIDVSTGNVM